MFKSGSIENELMHSMEKQLVSSQIETKHNFNKLAKAFDLLNVAADIFDKSGLYNESNQILDILTKLAKDSVWEDEISGGLADEYNPKDFDQKTLEQGKKVEREHTSDPNKATEIAMDHMIETNKSPNSKDKIKSDYYKELAKLEKKLEND